MVKYCNVELDQTTNGKKMWNNLRMDMEFAPNRHDIEKVIQFGNVVGLPVIDFEYIIEDLDDGFSKEKEYGAAVGRKIQKLIKEISEIVGEIEECQKK